MEIHQTTAAQTVWQSSLVSSSKPDDVTIRQSTPNEEIVRLDGPTGLGAACAGRRLAPDRASNGQRVVDLDSSAFRAGTGSNPGLGIVPHLGKHAPLLHVRPRAGVGVLGMRHVAVRALRALQTATATLEEATWCAGPERMQRRANGHLLLSFHSGLLEVTRRGHSRCRRADTVAIITAVAATLESCIAAAVSITRRDRGP